jgi:hypothetical protein
MRSHCEVEPDPGQIKQVVAKANLLDREFLDLGKIPEDKDPKAADRLHAASESEAFAGQGSGL